MVGDTYKIEITTAPANATEKIIWYSENSEIVTVDNHGLLTAVSIGSTWIGATSSSNKVGFSINVVVTPYTVEIESFSLVENRYEVAIGDSVIVETIITPANATEKLEWYSSDENVATVVDGVVTAVGNGIAFITARNNGYGIACRVRVYTPVTDITFDQDAYVIEQYKSITIGVTFSPSDVPPYRLNWTSSDPDIAGVGADGTVWGLNKGTATITITCDDGGMSKSCTVTVVEPQISVAGISIEKQALELLPGDTAVITATITPSNATNKEVIWTTSDASVATVSSTGQITAIGTGTAIITVTSVDGGYTATCTVTVVEPPPLAVKASIGVGYYMSSSGSVRGVFVEAEASGGSGDYVEYYIKVYFNGRLVAEGAKDEIIVTVANGTYTAEVYVKDSNGNEAIDTRSMTLSGY